MTQADELKKLQAENAWLREENAFAKREHERMFDEMGDNNAREVKSLLAELSKANDRAFCLEKKHNAAVIERDEQIQILKAREEKLVGAAQVFANIEADDGDDFEGVHADVILRVEITAGDLHRLRETLKSLEISGQSSPDSKTLMTQLDPLNGSDRANIADHDMRIKGVQMTEATKRLFDLVFPVLNELSVKKCPTSTAHPQSVWWQIHVQDKIMTLLHEVVAFEQALSTSPSDGAAPDNSCKESPNTWNKGIVDGNEAATSPSEGEERKLGANPALGAPYGSAAVTKESEFVGHLEVPKETGFDEQHEAHRYRHIHPLVSQMGGWANASHWLKRHAKEYFMTCENLEKELAAMNENYHNEIIRSAGFDAELQALRSRAEGDGCLVTSVHLYGSRNEGPMTVAIEINKKWIKVIEDWGTNISHISEIPASIRSALKAGRS